MACTWAQADDRRSPLLSGRRGNVTDYVVYVPANSIFGKIPFRDLPRKGPIDPNAIYKGCNFVQKTKPRYLQPSQTPLFSPSIAG